MTRATLENRVTVVEQKVAENEKGIARVWDAIVELRASMDRRFEAMEQRLDRRFEAMDLRFDAMEQRFDQRFRWLIGIVAMSLVAMLTIVGAALFRG